MARNKPTDKYKKRAEEVLQPEEDAVAGEYGKNIAANIGLGGPGAFAGGAAAGAKALGVPTNQLAGRLLGKAAGAAALGSVAVPAAGLVMAERRLGKARKSIEENLPKIEKAQAKNKELRAKRKPPGRPV